MKILYEDGIFAKLAKKARERRDAIRAQRQDLEDNKDKYAVFDEMIENLAQKGYSNAELNYLQRYLLISNSFDKGNNADMDENMLYQAAMNTKLTSEKIMLLGKIASTANNYDKEDFLWMASAGNVDQIKALHYAHGKNIPFKEIGSFSSKPPNTNTILNVINNYAEASVRKDSKHADRLSFTVSKGYDVRYLKSSRYEQVPDNVLADCIVADVYGKDEQDIVRALDKYVSDFAAITKALASIMNKAGEYGGVNPNTKTNMDNQQSDVSIYAELSMPDEVPHYSLKQLSTKSAATLKRDLRIITRKAGRAQQRAAKVKENEVNAAEQE